MPWYLDPRYVRENCYDDELMAGTQPHVDDIVKARLALLVHRPTAGMPVAGFDQMYVVQTQHFQVPTPAGLASVPSLWIVYVLIPQDQLIRPLYITRATQASADLQQLAIQALVHFRRSNLSS